MRESDFSGELEQRHGFKRHEQAECFIGAHLIQRAMDLVAGMVAGAEILSHVEGDNSVGHTSGLVDEVYGLESVSSMENCVVALTA